MTTLAIVCVGDELLDGRVVDTNARFLIEQSRKRDLQICEWRVIADDLEAIRSTLDELNDHDQIVVSGGLGPTVDDVTRQAAANFAGSELVEDRDAYGRLRRRVSDRNRRMTDNNRRQCRFPADATILPSEVGTADGFRLDHLSSQYYFFPGVPREFRWFAQKYIPAFGESETGKSGTRLHFFGLGESDLAERIDGIVDDADSSGVDVGFRADFPIIEVSITGDESATAAIEAGIRQNVGDWLVATDDQSLSGRVGERLVEQEATVCVAESCTAGLLGAELTRVSGSSRYFEEGYLTYSNSAKQRLLDVDAGLLERHGAVSPQVVTQMAAGARRRASADFALAISGIAGPTGGTDAKPVGTVDVALATPDSVFYRRSQFLKRTRRDVRILSVHVALAALLWHLEDRLDDHRFSGPHTYESIDAGIQDNRT